MKRLDRFIIKAFLGPFAAILIVVVFILMMQFLWLYIDELVGKGLGLGVVLEFLFWGICTILPLAIPLSTLLASMMVVGSMGENKELMAIKAAGISLARVFLPLSIASFIISIGAFFAGNNLVPIAYNEIFTLRDDIGKTKEEIKIPSGTFYEGIEGYVLRVGWQTTDGMMHGVMVYDHTGARGNTSVTLADSATISMNNGKDFLIFTLYHGCNYQETNQLSRRDTSLQLQKLEFDRQELVIPLKNYAFEKSDTSRFGDQAKSQNLGRLTHSRDSLRHQLDSIHDRYYRRFFSSTSIPVRDQIDTSRRKGVRSVFTTEKPMDWETDADRLRACEQALEEARNIKSEAASYTRDCYESTFYIRRTLIEILKKYAQALACFILFFIGAPLGALIKKGGLGTSAIVSVLFFVLYWVIDISGTKLARDGAISASIGVFISTYILAPIGGFLTWKAINDEEVFNTEAIKNRWRILRTKFRQRFKPARIVFMGTPEFAVASLDALVKAGYKVVAAVTVADKPSGRGLQMNESAVKKYALSHGIPVLQPVKLKDPEFLKALSDLKPDLFVVVAFRMLPEEVWSMPPMGTFNLHAALLPQYRGAAPINWAVINGEKLTGVTTFMIDKDIDTGGIIYREDCRIEATDTAGDIHDKLMEMGAKLVLDTTEAIIQKTVELRVQRSFIQGSEVLKPAPKLTRELCEIDWHRSSAGIYNLIRGLSPYPTAFTTLHKADGTTAQLKVFFAEKCELQAAPGEVLTDGRTYFAVGTADGALSLKDVQLSGKKRMDIKSFLAGFRDAQNCNCGKEC